MFFVPFRYIVYEEGDENIYLGNILMGDLNGDGGWNVLDIVILSYCILQNSCEEHEYGYAGDLNDDDGWNVLDIVILANCVLMDNCSGI